MCGKRNKIICVVEIFFPFLKKQGAISFLFFGGCKIFAEYRCVIID